MTSKFRPLLALIASSLVLTVTATLGTPNHGLASPDSPWDSLGEEDGVRIYRRNVPGSGLYEFRGVGVVNTSMAKIIAVLSDASKMPRWLDGCIYGQLVEKNYDEGDLDADYRTQNAVFYAVNKAPWPLHNRDYVVRSNVLFVPATDKVPAGLTIDSQTIKHPKFPPKDGLVRLPNMHSKMALSPVSGSSDRTEVDFSIVLDPGGVLPDFIVNLVSHDLPLKTLTSLGDLVKDRNYNRALEKLVQHNYDRGVSSSSNDQPLAH